MVRRSAINSKLFYRKSLINQLLAVRHVFGKLRVRAFLCHLEPSRIVRITEGDDLGLVIFESLDRFLIDRVGFAFEVGLEPFCPRRR